MVTSMAEDKLNGRAPPADAVSNESGNQNVNNIVLNSGWIVALAIAIIALCLAVWAVTVAVGAARDADQAERLAVNASLESSAAAERADKSERAAVLAREYVVTTYSEIQREFAVRGMSVLGPFQEHDPVAGKVYADYDAYIEQNSHTEESSQ